VEEIRSLAPEAQSQAIKLANDIHHRRWSYAMTGMLCGTVTVIACVGGFVFLVVGGHDIAAGALLGTSVLTVIAQIIRARL
jgi:hypothetical protein